MEPLEWILKQCVFLPCLRYEWVGRTSDLSVENLPTFHLTFTSAIITTSYYHQRNNNAATLLSFTCCAARGGMLAVRL